MTLFDGWQWRWSALLSAVHYSSFALFFECKICFSDQDSTTKDRGDLRVAKLEQSDSTDATAVQHGKHEGMTNLNEMNSDSSQINNTQGYKTVQKNCLFFCGRPFFDRKFIKNVDGIELAPLSFETEPNKPLWLLL